MRRRDGQDNVTHEQNILDYLQNRLSAARKDAFEQMMAEDAALAAEVEVMRAVRRELAAGPKLDNAEAVWERVSASIDAQAVPANDNRSPLKQVLKYAAVVLIAVGAWQVTVVPRISAVPASIMPASAETPAASQSAGHAPERHHRMKGQRLRGGGPSAGRNASIQFAILTQHLPS